MKAFNDKQVRIYVEATNFVDFSKIDPKITSDGAWGEQAPMFTHIFVPKKNKAEIIEKLKLHNDITMVEGELTANGVKHNQSPKF